MPNIIKSFLVGYDPINKSNTFVSGDYITGQITLELSQECKIQSLFVKLKGKAEVLWREYDGKTVITYHSKDKYFTIKQFVIQESQGNTVIPPGCHVYPFTFQIPAQELPSSFRGSCGKIVYRLEANLSRSMRKDSKAKAEFTLIHKENLDRELMTPQQDMTDKKMNLFTSGSVAMDVSIPKTAFLQGEDIKVVASVQNKSSRDIKLKYCLYRKYSYFASKKRKLETKDILKEEGEAIPQSAGQTVTKIITVPSTETASVLNCNIIKVEYRLRVHLDVKYASNPEIKFPIVILPALEGSDKQQSSDYSASGFEASSNSDFPEGASFLQNPAAPGVDGLPPSYETYDMYPSLNSSDRKS
ncbi:arrestin domain-containing protein 3 [Oreochromis niloticus]|uniref:arrestin domain-containing protein 3 n=1 Tax=Oreochromis niloticus TaxID=8128 RepID=UPI00022B3CFE|nr:arrestin domain-containing protein 3 [Oreochromis niloticus]XP_039477080.1 arrestin domain-containing protein 3-like [Oreochromis aureus]